MRLDSHALADPDCRHCGYVVPSDLVIEPTAVRWKGMAFKLVDRRDLIREWPRLVVPGGGCAGAAGVVTDGAVGTRGRE